MLIFVHIRKNLRKWVVFWVNVYKVDAVDKLNNDCFNKITIIILVCYYFVFCRSIVCFISLVVCHLLMFFLYVLISLKRLWQRVTVHVFERRQRRRRIVVDQLSPSRCCEATRTDCAAARAGHFDGKFSPDICSTKPTRSRTYTSAALA